jgi:hypothetical protein
VKNRFQNLPFKFNLQRYNLDPQGGTQPLSGGGLYKHESSYITHTLESAWPGFSSTHPCGLSSENLVSKFCFQAYQVKNLVSKFAFKVLLSSLSSEKPGFKVCFQIPTCTATQRADHAPVGGGRGGGLYKLNPVDDS